jgi:hypothetical protein
MRVVTAESIETPSALDCARCGAHMRLFGIEAHPTLSQVDLRTYVCTQCDGVRTEILPPRLGTIALTKGADDADG